jgi:hypothetical protein
MYGFSGFLEPRTAVKEDLESPRLGSFESAIQRVAVAGWSEPVDFQLPRIKHRPRSARCDWSNLIRLRSSPPDDLPRPSVHPSDSFGVCRSRRRQLSEAGRTNPTYRALPSRSGPPRWTGSVRAALHTGGGEARRAAGRVRHDKRISQLPLSACTGNIRSIEGNCIGFVLSLCCYADYLVCCESLIAAYDGAYISAAMTLFLSVLKYK